MKGSGVSHRKTDHHFQYGNCLKGNYSVTILPCAAISFKRCTII